MYRFEGLRLKQCKITESRAQRALWRTASSHFGTIRGICKRLKITDAIATIVTISATIVSYVVNVAKLLASNKQKRQPEGWR